MGKKNPPVAAAEIFLVELLDRLQGVCPSVNRIPVPYSRARKRLSVPWRCARMLFVKPLLRSSGMAAARGMFCRQRAGFNRGANVRPFTLDVSALHSVTSGAAAARKGVAGFVATRAVDIPHGEWNVPPSIRMMKPFREAFPRLHETFPMGNAPFPTLQERMKTGNGRRDTGNASEKAAAKHSPSAKETSGRGMEHGRRGKTA